MATKASERLGGSKQTASESGEGRTIPPMVLETEISPGKILVGMNPLELNVSQDVPPGIWEPLFRGELEELWNVMLQGPGDQVVVHGSTVAMMLVGKWTIDTQTGRVPSDLRSDLDVVMISDKVNKQFHTSRLGIEKRTASSLVRVGGVQVGVVSQDHWRNMGLAALDEFVVWAEGLDDLEIGRQFSQRAEDIKTRIQTANLEGLQQYTNLFGYESLSLVISRNSDGGLSARFLDPTNLIERIKQSYSIFPGKLGVWGYRFDSCNSNSIQNLLIEALPYMESVEFSNKTVPMAMEALSRTIVAACERDIVLVRDVGEPPEGWFLPQDSTGSRPPFYETLYRVAQRWSDGDSIITLPPGTVLKVGDTEYHDVNQWMHHNIQKSFARSCASNPMEALDYVCINFPLFNKCISEDLEPVFREFHTEIQSDKPSPEFFIDRPGMTLETLPVVSEAEITARDYPGIVGVRAALNYKYLIARECGLKFIKMEGSDPEARAYFPIPEKEPAGMSEIMAILLVSCGWNSDTDIGKIQSIVDGWKPHDKLELSWKTGQSDFDTGLDTLEIVSKMKYFKELLKDAPKPRGFPGS